MIQKPLVLHTSLPRLAEAVVKSLDPTHKQMRAETQSAATVILHELVKTYPSITFDGASQRLAVGTQEGATIVYDLKTATRLAVLESYTKPVTACGFSPDGHRLVTVALDEGRAEVWKVASGVLGYFSSSVVASLPHKIFPFNVGDEGMSNLSLGSGPVLCFSVQKKRTEELGRGFVVDVVCFGFMVQL